MSETDLRVRNHRGPRIPADRGAFVPAAGSVSVLHVVETVGRGAVESWLVRMLTHARRRGTPVDWTFYCTLGTAGPYEEIARVLGARVVPSPVPLGRKAAFAAALRRELQRGDYDVLHCHHDLVSGLYLAASLGLPLRRIVHVHNADENVPTPDLLKQRIYRRLLRRACLALADRVVGISDHTLDTFLAGRPRHPGRDVVRYYGVDPSPFSGPGVDREGFRTSLGLAEAAPILLFGGRIVPEKNPVFAVDVLASLRRLVPDAVAVFAGSGSLEAAVLERAHSLGVASAVRMLGWRSDISDVMRCADWFILPRPEHPQEGFGLAVVEAQLAGLRLLVSCGIPDDAILPGGRVRRLSLAAPPERWADVAAAELDAPPPSAIAAQQALSRSPMEMNRALDALLALYT